PLRPLSIVPLSFLGFPAQSGRESRPGRFSWQEESESWAVESCARLCKTVNPPRGCRDLAIHTRTLVIESPGEKRRVSSSESAKQKPALERRQTLRLAAGSNKRQAPDFRETFLRSVPYLYRKAGTVFIGDLSQNPGGRRPRPDGRGETVRVNLPLELAEKVLPAVNHDRLHNGKVRIDPSEMNDVDLRALMEAIRTAKEGQYVTVEGDDNHVRVAKEGNHLTIHVRDKSASKKSQVEVKVPIKVIDALLSAGKDELDLVAALHALGAQGDTELVSVQD